MQLFSAFVAKRCGPPKWLPEGVLFQSHGSWLILWATARDIAYINSETTMDMWSRFMLLYWKPWLKTGGHHGVPFSFWLHLPAADVTHRSMAALILSGLCLSPSVRAPEPLHLSLFSTLESLFYVSLWCCLQSWAISSVWLKLCGNWVSCYIPWQRTNPANVQSQK